jgi:hypothetical protein
MKNEMPPSTTIAPMAITTASVPVKPPPEELELGVVAAGAVGVAGVAGVVVAGAVGVGVWDCGRPGESGFPGPGPGEPEPRLGGPEPWLGEPDPWANATAGTVTAIDSAHRRTTPARTEAGRQTTA